MALGGAVMAQEAPHPLLAKGKVVEEAEHDLDGAAELYAQVADDGSLGPAVRAEAFLRLARVRQRQGDLAAARVALESATDGQGSAAEAAKRLLAALQDPQRADGSIDLEILRLMTVVREQQGAGRADEALDELAWFGDRAVPLLVEAVRTERDFGFVTCCARGLMKIGGPKVEAWIDEATKYEEALRRRAVARAADARAAHIGARRIAAFLGDPSAEVRLQAVESGVLVDWAQALATLRDEDERVRRATIRWLCQNEEVADRLPPPGRRGVVCVDLIAELDARASEIGASSFEWIIVRVRDGVRQISDPEDRVVAALALARAQHFWPPRRADAAEPVGSLPRLHTPNALVPDLLRTARLVPGQRNGLRADLVGQAFQAVRAGWDRTALDAVLELAQLGFPCGTEWLVENAAPGDWVAIFGALDAFDEWDGYASAIDATVDVELPAEAFGPLQRAFERWLADVDGPSRAKLLQSAALRLCLFDHEEALAWSEHMLVAGLAATGLVERRGDWLDPLRHRMLSGVFAKDTPARRATARRIAVAEGDGLAELRNQALAWLAFVHDVQTTPLVAKAYELGLVACRIVAPPYDESMTYKFRGLRWFRSGLSYRFGKERRSSPEWTGPELAELVEPCLSAGGEDAWADLELDSVHEIEVLEAALRQLDRCSRASKRRDFVAAGLRSTRGSVDRLDVYRAFVLRGLADESGTVRRQVFEWIRPGEYPEILSAAVDAAVVRTVADPYASVASAAISFLQRTGDERYWDPIAVRLGDPDVRAAAMTALLHINRVRALDVILPLLGDRSLRLSACHLAKQTLDRRFVPLLLDALRDENEETRKVAREALEAIEFYVSQEARWKRLLDDAGIDAPNAAEALLRQAREAKDQRIRLTAIRSLGTLAVPETLPFLIQLMQDPDAAIAQAAADAVERINARK